MKIFNLVTLILTIIAGLDVGAVALTNVDPIAYLFGAGSTVTRTIGAILGLSALYQLYPFFKALSVGEIRAETSRA